MYKIAVLASGSGSNMQSIIDKIASGELNASIEIVICDREAGALERAKRAGIDSKLIKRSIFKSELSNEILKVLDDELDLIVLAGYLSIFSDKFIKKWGAKMINIHPSLLPKFGGMGMYGMNVHKAVISSGEKESGCTVHFVDCGVDTGAIIMQKKLIINSNETAESLQKRVLELEHELLPEAIKSLIFNKKS